MERGTTSGRQHGHDEAVSEITGTLILIVIAVTLFASLAIIILNPWLNYSDETPPNAYLVGMVKDNNVVIEHRGGFALDPKTRITITIDGAASTYMVNQFNYWTDANGDGVWNIGEQYVFPGGNLQGKKVTCVIVDSQKNMVIFDKTLQSGSVATSPYPEILEPSDVSESSATVNLYYNFINVNNFATGNISFIYGPTGGPYVNSSPAKPLSIFGYYGLILTGLSSGTQYQCWAQMNYSGGVLLDGPIAFYTYQSTRGLWHLDEPLGSTLAYDTINPVCNGSVFAATFGDDGVLNGALSFNGDSDYVNVPHHPKLNITDNICIESWLNLSKTGAEFPGRITDLAVKNISDILAVPCYEPDLIQIDSTTYAVAYHDNISAYVTTFRMTQSGIFQGVLDTQTIFVTHFNEPRFQHISNQIYAIIYGAVDSQTDPKNYIVTMTIDKNGTISPCIDTFEFPTYYGRASDVLSIGSELYMLSFGGTTSQMLPTGYLVTVHINSLGQIDPVVIDSLKLPDTYCSETSIVHLANETYAIAYNGCGPTAGQADIITLKILNNGSIVQPFIDGCIFGVPAGLEPKMIPIQNYVYAIAYSADANQQLKAGFLQTVSIDYQGHILNTSLDTLILPVPYIFQIDFMVLEDNIYALTFTGGNNSNWDRGYLATIIINDTGNISNSVLSLYEFDDYQTSVVSSNVLLDSSNELISFYSSTNSSTNGFVSMEKITLTGASKLILHKGDAFEILVNNDLLIGTMVIGGVTYSVTGTAPFDTWTKIDFTYGLGFLKLYINDALQAGGSTACSGTIATNTDSLIFGGGFYGSLDEIKISRSAYVP
jgi:flagellin-like protein